MTIDPTAPNQPTANERHLTGAAARTEESMSGPRPKDVAASARVLGIATVAWVMGSAGSGAPRWALPLLIALAVIGLVTGVRAHRLLPDLPGRSSHEGPGGHEVSRRWLVWTLVEAVLIVAGGVWLGRSGHPMFGVVWAFGIFGLHLFPLASLYRLRSLTWCGIAAVLVAVIAALAQARGAAPSGVVVGTLGCLVLVVTAIAQFRRARAASSGVVTADTEGRLV